MKKKLLPLLFLSSLLVACEVNQTTTNNDDSNPTQQSGSQSTGGNTQTGGNTGTGGTQTGGNTETGGTQTGGNTETEEDNGGHSSGGDAEVYDIKDIIPENSPLELSDKTDFTWHDGREPEHNPYWDFYIGTSKNTNGVLWENPKADYSGPEFKKNCYVVSPMFQTWKKIEVHLYFWCSSHTSDKYKAAKNEPQLIIEEYDKNGNRLNETFEIEIARSDVPNNGPLHIKKYLDEDNCSFFIVRFNNYIPNGESGYSLVLCDASLKGWQYDV